MSAGLLSSRLATLKPPAYCSRASTFCGLWLAIESTVVPACTRIWLRVRAAVSLAKSASRIELWASVRSGSVSVRVMMLVSRRRPLEGAQPAAERGDLGDHLIDDQGRALHVGREGLVAARPQLEQRAVGAAQAWPCSRPGCPGGPAGWTTTSGPSWKLAPPPVMVKFTVSTGREHAVDLEADVQRRGVDRRLQTLARGHDAVDAGQRCRCPHPVRRERRRCRCRRRSCRSGPAIAQSASLPYSAERKTRSVPLSEALTPVASDTRLMASRIWVDGVARAEVEHFEAPRAAHFQHQVARPGRRRSR